MPETTSNDQWIWELDERICAMTDKLYIENDPIEITPCIDKSNAVEEKKEGEKANYDFYRPSDTKVTEDIHLYLAIEAALAAM